MTDTLDHLVERLVELAVLTPDDSAAIVERGVPTDASGRWYDEYGVLDEQGVPALWWTTSLVQSEWWFPFFFDSIAHTQIDDGMLDVIAPAVASLGVDLVHDWNRGDQPLDPALRRIWINESPVDYGFPQALSCVQPLARVNELLSDAGADRRFYFSGVQWEPSCVFFVNEDVATVLMPIEAAELLAVSPHVIDAARPYLIESILVRSADGQADSNPRS